MRYEYKGKEYPQELKLNYPVLGTILNKPKDDITLGEASWLLRIDADKMREDCNALILNEVGTQHCKSLEQLREDESANPDTINNALILLTGLFADYDGETSNILLELLRQKEDFLKFNNISLGDDMTHAPIATAIYRCYCLSPQFIMPLLLEKEVSDEGKRIASEMIGVMGSNLKQHYEGANVESYDELCKVLKDVFNKYAKDYPNSKGLDRKSLSYLIEIMSTVGIYDHTVEIPFAISRLFSEGYIDEEIINDEDALDGLDGNGWECEEPVTDVRELLLPKLDDY